MTTSSQYLTQVDTLLRRLDLGQIDTMIGYLTRLRDRKGRLYVWDGTQSQHVAHRFSTRLDAAPWTFNANVSKTDAILTLSSTFTAFPDGPSIYAIIGADAGDVARRADTAIIIPTFDPSHLEAVQGILWHLLIGAL